MDSIQQLIDESLPTLSMLYPNISNCHLCYLYCLQLVSQNSELRFSESLFGRTHHHPFSGHILTKRKAAAVRRFAFPVSHRVPTDHPNRTARQRRRPSLAHANIPHVRPPPPPHPPARHARPCRAVRVFAHVCAPIQLLCACVCQFSTLPNRRTAPAAL